MSIITNNLLFWKQPQRPVKSCADLPVTDGGNPTTQEKYASAIQLDETYKSSNDNAKIPEGAYKISIRPHEDGYTESGVASTFSIDDILYKLGDEKNSEYELDHENCVQDLVPSKTIKNVIGVYMIRLVYPSESSVTKAQLDALFL